MRESDLRQAAEAILERVTRSLATLGFASQKPGTFAREREHVLEWLQIGRVAAQPVLRVQCGVRVKNDPTDALESNGPSSDRHRGRGADFRLEFGPDSSAQDACVADLVRFALTVAVPWFESCRTPSAALAVLGRRAHAAWEASIKNGLEPARVAYSRRLLGLDGHSRPDSKP